MPAKPSGKIKTATVRVKQKNGDIYIFERESIYDPDKKYNKILSSKLISKIPKGEDTPVPTRPKRKKGEKASGSKREPVADNTLPCVPDAEVTASRKKAGMMDLIDHIGKLSGVDDAVYSSTDRGTAQKIISLARYLVGTNGQSFPGITVWQYTHPLPYEDGISEDVYHELFERVGRDESLQQSFFANRCRQIDGKAVLAYDSTTISSYSEGLPDVRRGFNKAHDGLDTVKLLTLYSIDTRQPVAFTKQPGNLPDVTSISNALAQLEALGVKRAEIVTDNGYYSENNLSEMLEAHFDFIMLIKTNIKWVKSELDKLIEQDAFRKTSAACPFDPGMRGIKVAVTHEFTKLRKDTSKEKGQQQGEDLVFTRRLYLHLYFDPRRRVAQDEAFDRDLLELRDQIEGGVSVKELSEAAQNKVKKYFIVKIRKGKTRVTFCDDAILEAKKYHGYFALVSNCEKDPFECLQKYRKRETIEFFFKSGKEKTDGMRTRVWDTNTLRGRMFVQFVALCYYEYLNEHLHKIKNRLGEKSGLKEHDTKDILEKEKQLKNWMNKTPVYLILQWFDTIEQVEVSSKLRQKRWDTEITTRDALFLMYFYIIK